MSPAHRAPVTPTEIRAALDAAGLAPRHRYGQNFLCDARLLDRIADLGHVVAGDVVLEVGPGLGGLTERLLSRGATVVAAEIDRGFCEALPGILGHPEGLHVVPGDVMATKSAWAPDVVEALRAEAGAAPFKVVSNLPYQISSPFVAGLALLPLRWSRAVVMMQKEVVDVLVARPGTADYSPLSFLSAVSMRVEKGPRVGPAAFYPRPQVDSQVAVLEPLETGLPPLADLLPFARRLFRSRRKALRGTLGPALGEVGISGVDAQAVLGAAGVPPDARIDGLEPARVAALLVEARRLAEAGDGA